MQQAGENVPYVKMEGVSAPRSLAIRMKMSSFSRGTRDGIDWGDCARDLHLSDRVGFAGKLGWIGWTVSSDRRWRPQPTRPVMLTGLGADAYSADRRAEHVSRRRKRPNEAKLQRALSRCGFSR
jgi:hypothetical protein